MDYITYRRFKARGINGDFNIRFGTIVTECDGFLYTDDGQCICAATSENGWEHFRPNTLEGAHRQEMLARLYQWYAKHGLGDDFAGDKWPDIENKYWKNCLRTASTRRLEDLCREKYGGGACIK